jgi:hypothetical protein
MLDCTRERVQETGPDQGGMEDTSDGGDSVVAACCFGGLGVTGECRCCGEERVVPEGPPLSPSSPGAARLV